MNGDKRHQFCSQRYSSGVRGIEFHLTFEEWCNIWDQSGHYAERGRGDGKYCMSRYGDIGAYEVGNVFIQLNLDNSKQAMTGRPAWNRGVPCVNKGRKYGPNAQRGVPKPRYPCVHCGKAMSLLNLSKWHNDNCKLKGK